MTKQELWVNAFCKYLKAKGYDYHEVSTYGNAGEGVWATVMHRPSISIDFTSAIKGQTTDFWRVTLSSKDFDNEAITGGLFKLDTMHPLERAIRGVLGYIENKRSLDTAELNDIETALHLALSDHAQTKTA